MLAINNLNHEILQPMSLAEIIAILSLEYEEDLTSLGKSPHHWLIAHDVHSGIMGGICLTPRVAKPEHHMLADFCSNLKSNKGWVASHLFCWIPETMDENNDREIQNGVAAFYEHLYRKFMAFCAEVNIDQVWIISSAPQHITATETGLWPFIQEMPFQHQEKGYVAALLPCNDQAYATLRQSHTAYHTSAHRLN